MKVYNRALEKRKVLSSVMDNTIHKRNDSKEENFGQFGLCKTGQASRRAFSSYRKDNGRRENQSGGSCSKDRRTEIQYQQDNAAKSFCEFGVFDQNGRCHGARFGIKNKKEKINNRVEELISVNSFIEDEKLEVA